MKRHAGPKGAELAARRKAAGLTQRQLAAAAGVGRTAVQYWEAAPHLDSRGWAVRRMAETLGWPLACLSPPTRAGWGDTLPGTRAGVWAVRPASGTDTRPRGDGLLSPHAVLDAWAEAQLAAFRQRETARAAHRRVTCGAKTRNGTPCRNKSEPGRRRCKFHGGKSTGARTPEGIERIREAQRRRWERDKSASEPTTTQDTDPAVTRGLGETNDARPQP